VVSTQELVMHTVG